MCGIAGRAGGEAADRSAVERMVGRLGHRGPDAQGIRAFDRCVLGHTRLRIIDLSPEADQPMANENQTVWAVFNGEIYNFVELRRELVAKGHRFRSESDGEVLVHLYEDHGPALAEHLRGMFAFAIWDEGRGRLVLCRDRLGIKPLYYLVDGTGISFASEVQALVDPSCPLDREAVEGYLRLGWVPGPGTIRRGVAELPPGHLLVWGEGQSELRPYVSPRCHPASGGVATTRSLREALEDGMARHLVADVPVGVFLSSGVDSAVVATLAARCSAHVRTYTVGFDTGPDEVAPAAELAREIGVGHQVVRLSGDEVVDSLDDVISAMDQPTVDGVNTYVISRAVRRAGVVVALSGLGGDELFGGYSTFRFVPRLAAGARATRFLPAGARMAPATLVGAVPRLSHSRARRALEAMAEGDVGSCYGAVRGLFSQGELQKLWPDAGGALSDLVHANGGEDGVRGLELDNYLPFQLLRDTDAMSMAHALEVRVPLLDDRVVDEAGSFTKADLVRAADPGLAAVAQRPKRTFTLPFDQWMRHQLRARVQLGLGILGDSELGFDRRELTDLWLAFLHRRLGWRPLWGLAVLGLWIEAHTGS